MGKAEQRALEAYPVCMCYNDLAQENEDVNESYRDGFEEGYRQAEKDLALAWEDVDWILSQTKYMSGLWVKTNPICEEILHKFNEQRNK